eukprot:227412_1
MPFLYEIFDEIQQEMQAKIQLIEFKYNNGTRFIKLQTNQEENADQDITYMRIINEQDNDNINQYQLQQNSMDGDIDTNTISHLPITSNENNIDDTKIETEEDS